MFWTDEAGMPRATNGEFNGTALRPQADIIRDLQAVGDAWRAIAKGEQPAAERLSTDCLGVDNWPADEWDEVVTGRNVITGEQEYTHVAAFEQDPTAEEYAEGARCGWYDYQD